MNVQNKHIVLIGFKHVGKSVVGKNLANRINRKFIDLDKKIEIKFNKDHKKNFSCRQIMQEYGESFFRVIEAQELRYIIKSNPAVIALGGGTPLKSENQLLIKSHIIIHLTALKETVFERIMIKGQPAFFPSGEAPLKSFNNLWKKRVPIYKKLATLSINNNQPIIETVKKLIKELKICDKKAWGDKK